MAGITRIRITDRITGRGSHRFTASAKRQPAANKLYQEIFNALNMPLAPGEAELECSLADLRSRYDHALGIDVILELTSGPKITLQEKFLFTTFETVTVEYMNNPRTNERGDWFNLEAQYYFVGYDRDKSLDFNEWILLSWTDMVMDQAINWRLRQNQHDGARANFRYAKFDQFENCIISTNSPLLAHLPFPKYINASP